MAFLEWLGLAPAARPDPETEVVHRIASRLDAMDPGEARHLALFAFLLARVAHVDLETTPAEVAEMERLVREHAGLPEAQAAMVVEIARATWRMLGPTHAFVATREFRDAADRDQKLGLLHCLFAVAAADGVITGDEEEEIRAVARGMLLEERDYLDVRSAWSEKRSVLRQGRATEEA